MKKGFFRSKEESVREVKESMRGSDVLVVI